MAIKPSGEEKAHVSTSHSLAGLWGASGIRGAYDKEGERELASMQHPSAVSRSEIKHPKAPFPPKFLLMYTGERAAESKEDHLAGQGRAIEEMSL